MNDPTNEPPTTLFSDNQSAITLINNLVSHAHTKYIDLHHHFIHEAIANRIIWVQYIPTVEMTADSLIRPSDTRNMRSVQLTWV